MSASMRRSSAFSTWSSMSNGTDGGRPLGFPVARCFFMSRTIIPQLFDYALEIAACLLKRHADINEQSAVARAKLKLRHLMPAALKHGVFRVTAARSLLKIVERIAQSTTKNLNLRAIVTSFPPCLGAAGNTCKG